MLGLVGLEMRDENRHREVVGQRQGGGASSGIHSCGEPGRGEAFAGTRRDGTRGAGRTHRGGQCRSAAPSRRAGDSECARGRAGAGPPSVPGAGGRRAAGR